MHALPAPLRAVLADDHPLVLAGLQMLFSTVDGITVVGEATHAGELTALLARAAADLLVVDLGLLGPDAFRALRELRGRHAALRILVLTGNTAPGTADAALAAGADGFLFKDGNIGALLPAIEALRAGRR
ncbi:MULTISPECIES: response regulator [Cupriavidus]|uniref:response regulator n=1 Tax=Cupriavidus TaxID=106589 RepID=UPI00035D9760|nr:MULTISPECIES: response regulator [Cupriavidus]